MLQAPGGCHIPYNQAGCEAALTGASPRVERACRWATLLEGKGRQGRDVNGCVPWCVP